MTDSIEPLPTVQPIVSIPIKRYFKTEEAAAYLCMNKSTMEKMRVTGDGPKFRRLGKKRIVYSLEDLDDWAGQSVFQSTSEAA